jgi:hypothetical protein
MIAEILKGQVIALVVLFVSSSTAVLFGRPQIATSINFFGVGFALTVSIILSCKFQIAQFGSLSLTRLYGHIALLCLVAIVAGNLSQFFLQTWMESRNLLRDGVTKGHLVVLQVTPVAPGRSFDKVQ